MLAFMFLPQNQAKGREFKKMNMMFLSSFNPIDALSTGAEEPRISFILLPFLLGLQKNLDFLMYSKGELHLTYCLIVAMVISGCKIQCSTGSRNILLEILGRGYECYNSRCSRCEQMQPKD